MIEERGKQRKTDRTLKWKIRRKDVVLGDEIWGIT
jgi:hypothetical protein